MAVDHWPTFSYPFHERLDLWLLKIESVLRDKLKIVPEVVVGKCKHCGQALLSMTLAAVMGVQLCSGSILFLSIVTHICRLYLPILDLDES